VRAEFARDLSDRVQLQQVVLNLVMNAADAMIAIDTRPRLLVVRIARAGSDHVCLAVQDAGAGFSFGSCDI
jgi:C4-dicarboxylate-specific signal transduction histidine kinase